LAPGGIRKKQGYNQQTFKKQSIALFSIERPHMRAFHFAWFAFFSCFIMWWAIPPLMSIIKKPRCLPADDAKVLARIMRITGIALCGWRVLQVATHDLAIAAVCCQWAGRN